MDASESEYGLTLTLHSKADSDIYKNNTPSAFTNNLKHPIKLSLDEQYELCLANIHSPKYHSCMLKKSDTTRNDINFHIGMFLYDEDESDWKFLKGSKIDLWTSSLKKDISGVELDNDVSRADFVKRFNNSFKVNSEENDVARKCLAIFNSFLSHKYQEGHAPRTVVECDSCEPHISILGLGYELEGTNYENLSRPWGNEFFQEFNPGERNHLRFKHVNDLPEEEKYHIFDLLMWASQVDMQGYIFNVLDKHRPDFVRKHRARKLLRDAIQGTDVTSWTRLQDIYADEAFWKVWTHSKRVPQLVLYASFGDKMSHYLSLGGAGGGGDKIYLASCGYGNGINVADTNPLLSPRFTNPKIGSLLVYSDLVKKSVRFASHITNLLGIVTIDNDLYNKPNPPTIYRPISHNFVQSVSVQITDENGEDICFGPDSYVALEILIRKRR